mgnify:CR=1 FL=1
MDIYLKRRRWKILLLFVAVVIGVGSLAYTNWLTRKMAQEERNKVILWAEATKNFNSVAIVPRDEQGNIVGTNSSQKKPTSSEMSELETNSK